MNRGTSDFSVFLISRFRDIKCPVFLAPEYRVGCPRTHRYLDEIQSGPHGIEDIDTGSVETGLVNIVFDIQGEAVSIKGHSIQSPLEFRIEKLLVLAIGLYSRNPATSNFYKPKVAFAIENGSFDKNANVEMAISRISFNVAKPISKLHIFRE
jgi:hypothetical protein